MTTIWHPAYNLILALWVGGMALFTLVVTPVIFKSYPRDRAGELVGRLFPGYFRYNLILSVLAMTLFFPVAGARSAPACRGSLILIAASVLINVFVRYKLHPAAARVKQEVASFERESPDSPARKKFGRLHALSAALNLFLLAAGAALALLSPLLKR